MDAVVRARILRAAAGVIEEAGLHPWTMATLARQAGVHRATLYRYFPTKSDLIEALPENPPEGAGGSGSTTVIARQRDAGAGLGQGRRRLIAAAREVFAEKGYEATSVREIAERATISKVMVYRHFGSKANLFREAIFDPFNEFITRYTADWAPPPAENPDLPRNALQFVTVVHDALYEHRDLLIPLLWPSPADAGSGSTEYLNRLARRWFALMGQIMEAELAGPRFRPFDRTLVGQLIIAMMLSTVIHDDWLFGPRPPDRDRLLQEMVDFTLFGIAGQPPRASAI
jgi:AcrR family transcriptional regulator